MEINDFLKNFALQFEETDASEFKPETIFKNLAEWSSLIALSVIAMVNEEYDVSIGAKEILGSTTLEDLFLVVKSKKV
jgi:acyl carrier protein